MHQKLKDARYENSEQLYFKALSEFEPPRPGEADAK